MKEEPAGVPQTCIGKKNAPKSRNQTTILQEIVLLLLKIAIILFFFILLFTFVFGIFQNQNGYMNPAVKYGDMVIFYRLDKSYTAGDAVVICNDGKYQVFRVIAVEGDTVDIGSDGLIVNGSRQLEDDIYEETLPYLEGVSFPLQVEEGKVFLLGDARDSAADSRIFGTIDVNETAGKVSLIIRRITV